MNLDEILESLEKDSGIIKQASETATVKPDVSAELSSILEKKASQNLTAAASAEGERLAKEMLAGLTKSATEIQNDNAVMVAQDNTKIVPVSAGTVEQVLETTVTDSLNRGAEVEDKADAIADKKGDGAGVPVANSTDGNNKPIQKQAEEKTMNKNPLIQALIEKLAGTTDEEVGGNDAAEVGAAPRAVNNLIQTDTQNLVAFDDAKVEGTPNGTMNQILQAIVAKAESMGGGSEDMVAGTPPPEMNDPQVEKAAAVSALVGEGIDFDTAVDLVKQAEVELMNDEIEARDFEKKAAFEALTEAGVDFDDAIELIKQAESEVYGE